MMDIVNNFKIDGKPVKLEKFKNGLINKTFLVKTTKCKYILQKINEYVFKNPFIVMDNIDLITSQLQNRNIKTLNIIRTTDNKNIYFDEETTSYYRMYDFLNEMENINEKNYYTSLEVGKAIGKFQNNLSRCETYNLKETIKDFHNTPKRLDYLTKVYQSLPNNNIRKLKSKNLYDYIIGNKDKITKIQEQIDMGIIPIRIAHNDTKLNNVMFDKKTSKAVAMIDLDTVMPGTILFDFGDAVRTTASVVDEDEQNFDLIEFDDKLFSSLVTGYLSQMYDVLTIDEVNNLICAVETIIMECAIRFLTDYLENDIYFKIEYDEHNFVRATNQVILFTKCVKKEKKWENIINILMNKFNY